MLLGILFFIVANFYSSVGFGGGSSYLALLILWNIPYIIIPIIALICNILVVSGNNFHYIRAGYINWRANWQSINNQIYSSTNNNPINRPVGFVCCRAIRNNNIAIVLNNF